MHTPRFLVLLMVVAFIAVPMIDQLACDFCGPTPETSMTAQPVTSHECQMKDEFKLPASSADGGGETHIHFCMLHATSIMLEAGISLPLQLDDFDLDLTSFFKAQTLPRLIYHPPTLL